MRETSSALTSEPAERGRRTFPNLVFCLIVWQRHRGVNGIVAGCAPAGRPKRFCCVQV